MIRNRIFMGITTVIFLTSCHLAPQTDTSHNADWVKIDTPSVLPYLYRWVDKENHIIVYLTTQGISTQPMVEGR